MKGPEETERKRKNHQNFIMLNTKQLPQTYVFSRSIVWVAAKSKNSGTEYFSLLSQKSVCFRANITYLTIDTSIKIEINDQLKKQ